MLRAPVQPSYLQVSQLSRTWQRFVATTQAQAHNHSLSKRPYRRHPRLSDLPPTAEPHILYSNRRRFQSAGLTALAVGQAGFWASAANTSTQLTDPMLGPAWTLFGFGLSTVFGLMISAYLRRMVAHVELVNGPVVRVTPHNIAGVLGKPVDIPAEEIVASPRGVASERHTTFGVKLPSGRTFYYIVDMKNGVVDREGIAAIVKGSEHLVAWSLKRDAYLMKKRWHEWRSQSR